MEISIGLGLEDLRVMHRVVWSGCGASGRKVTAVVGSATPRPSLPLFPFHPDCYPSSSRCSRHARCTSALPSYPPPHRGRVIEIEGRMRENESESPPFHPSSSSLAVLYLSSLASTKECHLRESTTEILINSYCDMKSSLLPCTVLFLDI